MIEAIDALLFPIFLFLVWMSVMSSMFYRPVSVKRAQVQSSVAIAQNATVPTQRAIAPSPEPVAV
ncbi:MAG: hypothetical protein SAJ72_20300 [Jaaginema sp. PMC 1080.18]|nr:hypothetical protein [Jaaginema sp. PMC 1080.18]MEC4867893.1 hypothetical protein [Jaaginema sp. PMC 1078.18]